MLLKFERMHAFGHGRLKTTQKYFFGVEYWRKILEIGNRFENKLLFAVVDRVSKQAFGSCSCHMSCFFVESKNKLCNGNQNPWPLRSLSERARDETSY